MATSDPTGEAIARESDHGAQHLDTVRAATEEALGDVDAAIRQMRATLDEESEHGH